MGGTKEERVIFEQVHLTKDGTGKFKWDVLVTSYEGILKEKSKLGKIAWRYVAFILAWEFSHEYCTTHFPFEQISHH
jgi:hypothetical protein